MKTIKTLGYVGAGGIAIALLVPAMGIAGAGQSAAADGGSHSLVHKVSQSLAGNESYTSSGPSGYKWGRKLEQTETDTNWVGSTSARSGYKWGDNAIAESAAPTFASTSSYEWGVKGYAEQAGYKWNLNSFANQAGYKWNLNSFANQAGYKWNLNGQAKGQL